VFLALNNKKERISPNHSGERAHCEMCGGEVTGKCGSIRVWHWQHLSEKDCDSWSEGETDWHKEWKERFPESWREIVVIDGEVKHRADIKTANGLVVEFQNSPISVDVVEKRESFYKNMIWVVNATSFAYKNFTLVPLSYRISKEISDKYQREYDSA
jgi:competence CoiA-like predicted nuclease